jgi:hypothetical protein
MSRSYGEDGRFPSTEDPPAQGQRRLLGRLPFPFGSIPVAATFFVTFGCLLRVIRYAQNLPLWSDECFLSVNFIHRGYAELLQPLDNGQIAPLLFLWAQRLAVDLVGFSEYGLRLFPLCCGLASVFLFWRLAIDVYGAGTLEALLSVGVLAMSVHPIRHAAEAKPYAGDLLTALVLLVPVARWLLARNKDFWIWILTPLAAPVLLLSNPAIFVAGGVWLGLLVPVWRTGRKSCRLALGCFGMASMAVFVLQYLTIGQIQSSGALSGLREYWASSFPPLHEPWRLLGWLLQAHTGSTFAYPGGGARGVSTASFVAFATGSMVLVRRGQGAIVACLIAPFSLAFVAAALGRYPYGSEARLMQFAAPAICLLIGQAAAAAGRITVNSRVREGLLQAALGGLVVCGILPQVVSFLYPYRMLYDHQQREFARMFWAQQAQGAQVACAHLDYGIDHAAGWNGRRAWYLCNQVIYSPSRRTRDRPGGRTISRDLPLRCVLFDKSPQSPAVQDWLALMEVSYMLRKTTTIDPRVTFGEGIPATEHWLVYEFVPRSSSTAPQVAGPSLIDRQRR